jgi:glycosyltransferase involved in cell wall biosynthesis
MTRVVYWNNIPAPYMVDRFNALTARGTLEFEAWFSARTRSDRSWKVDEASWDFPYRYLPAIGDGMSTLALPTPLFGRRVPDVFVSLYAAPAFILGWALARARGARTAFWVEATNEAWITRRRWKEAVKSKVLPRADAILTAGEDGRSFARKYGAQNARIHHVPHVIDVDHYSRGSSLSDRERESLRAEIGVRGVTFSYVGRIYVEKGLTFLLDAFAELQRRDVGEVSLLLVGDGPDEGFLRQRCEEAKLQNVVFYGFREAQILPSLYACSDTFVFPTLGEPFGIAVLEAMACRLPVIATMTAGEIASRVTDGVNGFVVLPGDSVQLLDRMTVLARDAELRQRMGRASAERVAGQTPDMWADAFEHAVEMILSSHPPTAAVALDRSTPAERPTDG